MSFTIKASNYRAHRDTVWTIPEGISAVVGVNGSGKTTLLMVGDILRRAVDPGSSGLEAAIEEYGSSTCTRVLHPRDVGRHCRNDRCARSLARQRQTAPSDVPQKEWNSAECVGLKQLDDENRPPIDFS